MQRREKLLLIGLLTALVLWQGVPAAYQMVWGPVEERQTQQAMLQTAVDKKKDQQLVIARANKVLRDAKAVSLPPDPLDAQRLYQKWLTELATLCHFSNLEAIPERRFEKDDTYWAVQVSIGGQATLEEVCRFLYHCDRADLLHRIARVSLKSTQDTGNPRLEVSLLAEGLAIMSTPPRKTLFPLTTLTSDITADDNLLEVGDVEGFPTKAPFRIRIGQEFLSVTAIDGKKWTVDHAIDLTAAEPHSAGTTVELAPVNPDTPITSPDVYRAVVETNPFTKPAPPYNPHFEPIADQKVIRGTPLTFVAKLAEVDPSSAPPLFRLTGTIPAELQIDPKTGEVKWNPGSEIAAGEYPVNVEATAGSSDQVLATQAVKITVKEPNHAPVVEPIAGQTAIAGRELVTTISAKDEDPTDKISYKLGEGAPAGATIDAETGEFRWTPAAGTPAGTVEVAIVVSDSGDPAMSTTYKLPVAVGEDLAQFTYLTAAVAGFGKDGEPQAWLYDRLSNKRIELRQGMPLKYAGLNATVMMIGRDFVVLNMDDAGWRLELGKNLREMKPMELAPVSTVPADPQTAAPQADSAGNSPG